MTAASKYRTRFDSTIEEMVSSTGFSHTAFLQWIRAGKIRAKPVGNKYMLDKAEVIPFCSTRKQRKKFLNYSNST